MDREKFEGIVVNAKEAGKENEPSEINKMKTEVLADFARVESECREVLDDPDKYDDPELIKKTEINLKKAIILRNEALWEIDKRFGEGNELGADEIDEDELVINS